MLRRILIASAAAILLVTTFHSDDAFARRGGGMHAGGYRGGAVAAGDTAVAQSLCAAGAMAMADATAIGAPIAATGSVRRRSGPQRCGAAAAGAYYGGGCGYDAYGNWVCPGY